jgi:chorismate mutase/prephenate dehydratase
MLKVGYQGVPGAYSEIAVIKYFGDDVEGVPYDNFREMITDVHNRKLDYAALPIENSTTGAITRALDLMKSYDVYVVGEEFVKVNHCIITFDDTEFEDLKTVYSHPEALRQCEDFFDNNKQINKVAYLDTSKSVEYIKSLGDKNAAAIASNRAAKIHGMKILQSNVQDNKLNTTRFGIITYKKEYVKDAEIVSMYLETKHSAGSLYRCIKVFSDYGVNMEKLESRPIQNKPFKYGFYIDIEGNIYDESTKKVIEEIKEHSEYLRIIGNYKKNRPNKEK